MVEASLVRRVGRKLSCQGPNSGLEVQCREQFRDHASPCPSGLGDPTASVLFLLCLCLGLLVSFFGFPEQWLSPLPIGEFWLDPCGSTCPVGDNARD